MEFYLHRWYNDSKAILGHLFVGREFQCFALEDPVDFVPEGRYKLSVYDSPKFRRKVLLLDSVPGRSYIEIHAGNTIADTVGCILVGQQLKLLSGVAFLGSSRLALDSVLAKFKEPGYLTISKELKWMD